MIRANSNNSGMLEYKTREAEDDRERLGMRKLWADAKTMSKSKSQNLNFFRFFNVSVLTSTTHSKALFVYFSFHSSVRWYTSNNWFESLSSVLANAPTFSLPFAPSSTGTRVRVTLFCSPTSFSAQKVDMDSCLVHCLNISLTQWCVYNCAHNCA